jgi:CHAT domain-containing protein
MKSKGEYLVEITDAGSLIDGLQQAPLGYRLENTYFRDKTALFDEAIRLACDQGDGARCCRFMEIVKSRTLSSTLGLPTAKDDVSPGERRVDELSAQNLTQPRPFDIEVIRQQLSQRGDAALGLFRLGQGVAVVLIDASGYVCAIQSVSPSNWSKLIAYSRNLQIEVPAREHYEPDAMGLDADVFVPKEILERALLAKRLILVPHRELHLLPWAALCYRGKRLFESCAVGILPNLASIAMLATELDPMPRLTLIGAPESGKSRQLERLRGALAEIDDLGAQYKDRLFGDPIVGSAATESAFWALSGQTDAGGAILHVACHASFDADDPKKAALFFADGKVDASEIARSHLRYDEVVLSACSTGARAIAVGDVDSTGDDIIAIPGAFLEAGVRSIFVSIPQADDPASGDLMFLYYEQRMAGVPPVLALQMAQKSMLADGEFAPQQWIGYTVYGAQ